RMTDVRRDDADDGERQQEGARQEEGRQEGARQEEGRQEGARQEEGRQEEGRQEEGWQEEGRRGLIRASARTKAAGLSGGFYRFKAPLRPQVRPKRGGAAKP